MRNLLSLAIAFAVVLTENDVLELGYNVTEEEFRSYFEIPADAVAGTYKHAEGFTPESLANFMNEEESKTLQSTAAPEEDAATAEAAPAAEAATAEAAPAADAKPETAAAKKKREAAEKKAADKVAKDAAKAATATAEPKKPGVIASILEVITNAKAPVSDADILAELVVRFPDRTAEAMLKTIKAQLGGKNQPLRMEDEKKVAFTLTNSKVEKEGDKSVRLYELAK